MLATSHALTAGIILKAVPNPAVSLPLVFLSHFALDLIPHWDLTTSLSLREGGPPMTLAGEKSRTRLAILASFDVLLGIGLAFWLFQSLNPVLLFAAIVLSQFPDWTEMPYYFWGIKFAPSVWMKKTQHQFHSRLPFPWGLLPQIALIAPLLWLTLK